MFGKKQTRVVPAVLVVTLSLVACKPLEAISETSTTSADPLPAGEVADQLEELTVEPEAVVDYDREQWPHWREVEQLAESEGVSLSTLARRALEERVSRSG